MIKYSIIIPVYNRCLELECCLTCLLQQQFDPDEFEIIVADDGSNDDTLSVIKKFASTEINIKYFWQPHEDFRAGQARNRGVQLMDKDADTIIFLDSDIIVKEDWLSTYHELHQEFPECVICGRYDFLLPMNIKVEDVIHRFNKVVSNQLPILFMPQNELIGADIRGSLFAKGHIPQGIDTSGALFGGNTLIPKKIFLEVGGFDERIVGHGGEDCDLGKSIGELEYKFIFSEKPIGWHLYHKRDQAKHWRELRKNISYIDSKHKK